jgi:hypothetical protein
VFIILLINYNFVNKTQYLFYKIEEDRIIGKKWLFLNNLFRQLILEFHISEIFRLIIVGVDEKAIKKKKNGRFIGVFTNDQAYLLFFPHKLIIDLKKILPEEMVAFGNKDDIKQKMIAWNTRNT